MYAWGIMGTRDVVTRMTVALGMIGAIAAVALVSCGRSYRPTSSSPPGDTLSAPMPSEPGPASPGTSYPLEATACNATADCERVSLRDAMELTGGPCCAVCAGYAALNRAWQARQPVCDPRARGACPVSCAEARPPPVACEAGRCVLTYPPIQAACSSDTACITVPRLLESAPASGCRLACGQYVAGTRDWDAWASSLWQNTSVIGVCPHDCVERLLPSASCVGGRCVIRAATVLRLGRVDLRAPTVTGSVSSAEIASVVTASLGRLTACEERPRSIEPIGYVGFQLHFVVGADGRVTDLDPGEIANHLPDIAACMARVIRDLRFPRPPDGGTTRVEYPMGAAVEAR